MEYIICTIIGAVITFFGYNYYQGVRYANTKKKVDNRKSEIGKMDTAALVALANSILSARRGNSSK